MAILFVPGHNPEVIKLPVKVELEYLDELLALDSDYLEKDNADVYWDIYEFINLLDNRSPEDCIAHEYPHDVLFVYHKNGERMKLPINTFATGIARAKYPSVNVYGIALLTSGGELSGQFYDNCYHSSELYKGLSFK